MKGYYQRTIYILLVSFGKFTEDQKPTQSASLTSKLLLHSTSEKCFHVAKGYNAAARN